MSPLRALLCAGALALTTAGSPAQTARNAQPAPDVVDVDISLLTSVDWRDGEELPEDIRALNGRTVILKGFMRTDGFSRVEEFLMVAAECQCSGRPQVQHFVDVRLEDEEVEYQTAALEVRGVLFVGPRRDEDGYVTSLYRLRRGSVY